MAFFSSNTVWTVPVGVNIVHVYAIGAGGGGQGGVALQSPQWGGSAPVYAGGGGAFVEGFVDVTGLKTVNVVVGAGGSGGPSCGNCTDAGNGSNGSLTSFLTIIAQGGGGDGSGGAGSGGVLNIPGRSQVPVPTPVSTPIGTAFRSPIGLGGNPGSSFPSVGGNAGNNGAVLIYF
jgi:hypothetical protein